MEVDYSLGQILASIYQDPDLRESLAFMGGTALRKAYFHDCRFSLENPSSLRQGSLRNMALVSEVSGFHNGNETVHGVP